MKVIFKRNRVAFSVCRHTSYIHDVPSAMTAQKKKPFHPLCVNLHFNVQLGYLFKRQPLRVLEARSGANLVSDAAAAAPTARFIFIGGRQQTHIKLCAAAQSLQSVIFRSEVQLATYTFNI